MAAGMAVNIAAVAAGEVMPVEAKAAEAAAKEVAVVVAAVAMAVPVAVVVVDPTSQYEL